MPGKDDAPQSRYLGDYPHGAYWSAERHAATDEDEPADHMVSGPVIRFMWDYGVRIPLWDAEGLLPEESEWLRETLGLSAPLIEDLRRWGLDMDVLDAAPSRRTTEAYESSMRAHENSFSGSVRSSGPGTASSIGRGDLMGVDFGRGSDPTPRHRRPITMKTIREVGTLPLVSLLLLAGCAGGSEGGVHSGAGDYPTYESVDALVDATDATLEVKVGGVASQELDDGGDSTDQGVPMAFWSATVVDVLEPSAADERVGDAIVIAWPDLDKEPLDGRSALKTGQTVVLFASRLTPTDAPGIDTQDVFYVPLGGDNGVMDVAGNRATARSDALTRLPEKAGDAGAAARLAVALSDLKKQVAQRHRKNSR